MQPVWSFVTPSYEIAVGVVGIVTSVMLNYTAIFYCMLLVNFSFWAMDMYACLHALLQLQL